MSRTPLTGAIATPHADATRSAERAFARGGNAIDAALAAAATLSVVYPHNVSIGGDLIALVRDPSGRTRCVNASGPAASTVDRDAMREAHGEVLPYRGIDTVTVPGAVRGWDALRRMGGQLEWGEIFTDAVAAAVTEYRYRARSRPLPRRRGGRRVRRGLPRHVSRRRPAGGGRPLVQPVLARTLEAIRDGGAAALYDGELTAGFVDGLARLGSRIGAADLLLFHPEVVEPLTTSFGAYRVLTSPPNTHGFVLLRVLRELERHGIADPLGADFGRMMERFFAANLVRDELLADPRVTSGDVSELLDGDASARGDEPVLPGFRRPRGDTVGIAASDSSGWSVSLIQSVYHAFGAAVVEPSTGILLHNRGTGFSLDPSSPNALAPGKRPLHTLMPVMVDDERGLRFVSATMGGQGQPQIHAQTLLRAMAGATAQEAVSAPRAIVGPQRDGDTPSDIYVEGNLAAPARDSLAETRLHIIETPDADELVGHANLVIVGADGGLDAGSDPRSDGAASVRGYGA